MEYLARPDAIQRRVQPTLNGPRPSQSEPVSAHDSSVPAAPPAAIVVALHHDPEQADSDASQAIIARYARGRDYHRVIKSKLLELLRWLEHEVGRPLSLARASVDTAPVLERELARRAGLGWFGRNTMLIHPRRGSYFFLGTLLVDVELELDVPFEQDHCGSCHACLDACPTNALLGRDENGAPVMDARRCISYLTIENRGPIPRELRPLVGNRVFGCDICQEVCPWNGAKFVQLTGKGDFAPREYVVRRKLIDLMAMNEEEWPRFSNGSAIRRAKRSGFLRNVAVALGNWGSEEAVPALIHALSDHEPLVRGHAAWALGRISSSEGIAALSARLAVECDEFVLDELRCALRAGSSRVIRKFDTSPDNG